MEGAHKAAPRSAAPPYQYVFIRGESYLKSADGSLMPTQKDQPSPDLKYFNQSER
jgi:hypothetical protein